jgi:hypothetical protein
MVDRYTKAVLTVIAACLVVIALRDLRPIGKAEAQSGPVHVVIDSVASFAFQFAGPLQVKQ